MAATLGSQLALTTPGRHFVYRLRGQFIKRILDTNIARIEQIGNAQLLACPSSDIRNITLAFVRLPELVQGIVLTYRFPSLRTNDRAAGRRARPGKSGCRRADQTMNGKDNINLCQ